MPAPIVFFDIAGPDADTLGRFYSEIFGWEVGQDGSFSAKVTSPLHGSFRRDPADNLLYFGVGDVAATLNRIAEKGGRIDVDRFEVPGVVVLGLFFDPAGNRMGLVEMDGDRAKVP